MTLLNLNTSELRAGDIVLAHGMRCLIDLEIRSEDRGGRAVYFTQALVLNRDDEATRAVPHSWTANWKRNARDEPLPHDGEHRWSIQGNELARWSVERTESPAEYLGRTQGERRGWDGRSNLIG